MLEDTLHNLKVELIETIVAPCVLYCGDVKMKSETLASVRWAGQLIGPDKHDNQDRCDIAHSES